MRGVIGGRRSVAGSYTKFLMLSGPNISPVGGRLLHTPPRGHPSSAVAKAMADRQEGIL